MNDLRYCVICNGPAGANQIDSSIGPLTTIQCNDSNCNGHWGSAWFQDEGDAVAWWNDLQVGTAAMSQVLPFNKVLG